MKNQKGFTLVELMIVVAIIGVLAAVAIPKFAQMLQKQHYAKYGRLDPGWKFDKNHEPIRIGSAEDVAASTETQVEYFKDSRTGLCFAKVGGQVTSVPCEKVSLYTK